MLSQSSFYSSNDPRLHFGLGSYTTVDIEVHWPNGLVESFKQVPVNRLITLREGIGRGAEPRLVQDISGKGPAHRDRYPYHPVYPLVGNY